MDGLRVMQIRAAQTELAVLQKNKTKEQEVGTIQELGRVIFEKLGKECG